MSKTYRRSPEDPNNKKIHLDRSCRRGCCGKKRRTGEGLYDLKKKFVMNSSLRDYIK